MSEGGALALLTPHFSTLTPAPPNPPLPKAWRLSAGGGFVPNYRCGAVPEWRERVTGFPF